MWRQPYRQHWPPAPGRPSDTRPTTGVAPGHGRRGAIHMRKLARPIAAAAGLLIITGLTAACGSAGSSGTKPQATASGAGCAPVADSTLVVLTDDKKLQLSDNVVPAVNKAVNNPALISALDAVSKTLSTQNLIALNKMVDSGGQTEQPAAAAYAQQNNITAGIQKGPGGKLTIGAADFSEAKEVANLYKIVLDAAGYTTTVQTIGNRELYQIGRESCRARV